MSRISRNTLAAAVLMGATMFGASAMAHAEAAPKAQCKSSTLAAWYDAQRQLTDGKADPFVASSSDARR